MTNCLLISATLVQNCLYYGGCGLIILTTLVVMGIMKSKTKKEMRASSVKKSCVKAKTVAEKILQEKRSAKFLAGSKLAYLNKFVEEAFWLAFQIADTKKDLFFEGVAGTLDGLSSELAREANNGYLSQEEYEKTVKDAIAILQGVIAKVEGH